MFFGAADLVLDANDPDYPTEVDAEIIGKCTRLTVSLIAVICNDCNLTPYTGLG